LVVWGMADSLLENARVDRSAFAVMTIEEAERADREYWRARTPDERLAALELSRQIAYGYDPAARRLSRFFEVVEFTPR
jgi:hypothetical protein